MTSMAKTALAVMVLLPLANGCSLERNGLLNPRPDSVAPGRTMEMLRGSAAREFVQRAARRKLQRGDRALFDSLNGAFPSVTQELAAGAEPSDPSTWGPAPIYMHRLLTSIGDVQFVFGEMTFGGTVGQITLGWRLTDAQGREVDHGGPYAYSEWNLLAPFVSSHMQATVPLSLGYHCGRTLLATGLFHTFYVAIPFSLTIPPITIPPQHYGHSSVDARKEDSAPACTQQDEDDTGDDGGDGTGAGGNGSGTRAIRVCYYFDHYFANGEFNYTENLGCEIIYLETS